MSSGLHGWMALKRRTWGWDREWKGNEIGRNLNGIGAGECGKLERGGYLLTESMINTHAFSYTLIISDQ